MKDMQKMKIFLGKIDEEKIKFLLDVKFRLMKNEINFKEAQQIVESKYNKITPQEFTFAAQRLKNMGIDDDVLCDIIENVLVRDENTLPIDHPIYTYKKENAAVRILLKEMEKQKNEKFIKNQWCELYEKLEKFKIHLSRKQNQLFSILEEKGFDRPSKMMWTIDNMVRDHISEAHKLLDEDKIEEFLDKQEDVIHFTRDIMQKEEDFLFPTALKLVNEEEYRKMRSGDDEIGYCLIDPPKGFLPKEEEKQKQEETETETETNSLSEDLKLLLAKHGLSVKQENKEDVYDVAQGKLTLDQINLIYKHLPIDLSYVDENDLVKFYSDTKHRIFPRSKGVIGRDVKNCHPKESLEPVLNIIEAFKSGQREKADFWLNLKGKFIYITYVAVRDEDGKFRGVLEMMQDATKIRSLEGNQTLLDWDA